MSGRWPQKYRNIPEGTLTESMLPDLGSDPELERLVRSQGSCRSHPNPEWWTAPGTETILTEYWDERWRQMRRRPVRLQYLAKQVCMTCPVLNECRDLADAVEIIQPTTPACLGGVWAGEGVEDRANRRRAALVEKGAALEEVAA